MSAEGRMVNGDWTPAPPRWFIFGEHADGLHVDMSDGQEDVLQLVPRNFALEVISHRDRMVDEWLARHTETEAA